jgi:hypothetical protein
VPSRDGRRALCVEAQISAPQPECKARVTRLSAAFAGEPGASSAAVAPASVPYFAPGAALIADPMARSKNSAQERLAQLWCGEPGWAGLRKGIENYCLELRQQREAEKRKAERKALDALLKGYCAQEPSSLLFQATNCTDQPLVCKHEAVSSLLTVNRAEFERGSDWLSMDISGGQCQVWFKGKGDSWRLIDHECNGD